MTRAFDLLPEGAPRLGFGCGDLFGGKAEADSIRLVKTALDQGVRWIDTARLYGNGEAEAVLGKVLPSVRGEVVLASKAGILPWSMRLRARAASKASRMLRAAGPFARRLVPEPAPAQARHGAFAPAELRRSVEQSLKALRTDYLDLLLLHECGLAHASRPETLRLLELLRSQGKVRRFGVATGFAETLAILREAPAVGDVVQFASDAFNHNVSALPEGWRGLAITHTPLRAALPRLAARLAQDPELAALFARRAGVAPHDRAGLAELLLADAAAANAEGVVVFSTSRPERIGPAVHAVARIDPSALAALREVVREARAEPQPGAFDAEG